jgi:hypothetical protein
MSFRDEATAGILFEDSDYNVIAFDNSQSGSCTKYTQNTSQSNEVVS